MKDLISRQAAIEAIDKYFDDLPIQGYYDMLRIIENSPAIDAVPVVRCKDCKHRPIDMVGKGYGEDLSFDDGYKCPCRCEDPFYSWMPEDDWFCANGERREDAAY